jgi:hypothetical protein
MFRFAVNPMFQTLLAAGIAAATFVWPASGAETTSIPNFSPDSRTGWIAGRPDGETPIGDDFLPPPSGPGPITFDKAHPYIDNQFAHVEDPGASTMPWSATQRYRRADRGPMGEQVCAENNARFFNYDDIEPIPTADKPDF